MSETDPNATGNQTTDQEQQAADAQSQDQAVAAETDTTPTSLQTSPSPLDVPEGVTPAQSTVDENSPLTTEGGAATAQPGAMTDQPVDNPAAVPTSTTLNDQAAVFYANRQGNAGDVPSVSVNSRGEVLYSGQKADLGPDTREVHRESLQEFAFRNGVPISMVRQLNPDGVDENGNITTDSLKIR